MTAWPNRRLLAASVLAAVIGLPSCGASGSEVASLPSLDVMAGDTMMTSVISGGQLGPIEMSPASCAQGPVPTEPMVKRQLTTSASEQSVTDFYVDLASRNGWVSLGATTNPTNGERSLLLARRTAQNTQLTARLWYPTTTQPTFTIELLGVANKQSC